MALLLIFALTLTLAALLSELAQRTIFSTVVLFLVVGFLCGPGVFGWVHLTTESPWIAHFISLALFAVLFTEGLLVNWSELKGAWRLPGRAILIGMPVTIALNMALAVAIFELSWMEALLLGAALSPTDPVLAAALVGKQSVPPRLRHLLNIESGLNDGLALPVVLFALGVLSHRETGVPYRLPFALLGGVLVGALVPLLIARLKKLPALSVAVKAESLLVLAISLLVLSVTSISKTNEFLGAFVTGILTKHLYPQSTEAFRPAGDLLSEVIKLLAVLIFGAVVSSRLFHDASTRVFAFAFACLFLVRPVALFLSAGRAGFSPSEWWAASWFGPKGFASIFYGLLILHSGVEKSDRLFHVIALVTVLSIILHSSTDVPVAKWLSRAKALFVAALLGMAGCAP